MSSLIPKLWLVGSVALAGVGWPAEDTPSSPGAEPRNSGLLSSHLKTALFTSLPGYDPLPPPAGETAGWASSGKASVDGGEVLVLPAYVVVDPRVIKSEDILSTSGKLERYLGPKDGLDRGLLNLVQLHWGSEVVSFSLLGAVKNETRAKRMYREEKRLRDRDDLLQLVSMLEESGNLKGGKFLKNESDALYKRKPAFERE